MRQPIVILFPCLGTPRMKGLCSACALLWAPEKAGLRHPLPIRFPFLGTAENEELMSHVRSLLGPREGRGEATTYDSLPLFGHQREGGGFGATSTPFGPPRRQG